MSTPAPTTVADPIPSPCIGLCRIEEESGGCLGSARTGDEISDWRSMGELRREHVWAELPARRAGLGLGIHRLPWLGREIRIFVADTLRRPGATWIAGVSGALAEFCFEAGEGIAIETEVFGIVARTQRAALRLEIDDNVRAIAFGGGRAAPTRSIVVLALPRERVDDRATQALSASVRTRAP